MVLGSAAEICSRQQRHWLEWQQLVTHTASMCSLPNTYILDVLSLTICNTMLSCRLCIYVVQVKLLADLQRVLDVSRTEFRTVSITVGDRCQS